jgi:methylthioribose-1-phosphate isomerase
VQIKEGSEVPVEERNKREHETIKKIVAVHGKKL